MIIGSKYIYRENLSSTNSHAATLLKNRPVQEGAIIYTNYQTAGRGQAENIWESEKGKNLLISIILYPFMIKPADQFIISEIISLGICDYLRQFTANVSIKWPNDIYVNNDKIAGILIEASIIRNEIENIIAGIGLNINQKIFKSDAPNPVSLTMITGKIYDTDECLKNLASHLDRRYKQLLHEKRSEINSDYLSNLYRFGQWSDYRDSNGLFEGRVISVTTGGRLQIEDRRGRIYEYGFKEVNFL
ncbi:MAG: biotin--[acetyl-CoA-carboxylase] ligase [Odoribacter sp.]|nr:biotin--[acetyl-CoA-carboxylase] ligase [Odoribacter sp.]